MEDERSRGRRAFPEGTRIYGIQRVRSEHDSHSKRDLEDEARHALATTLKHDGYVLLDAAVGKWETETHELRGEAWTWEVYRLKGYAVPV